MAIKASATITIFNVDDVDSLDVGGRNLALNSKNYGNTGWTSTSSTAASCDMSESWIEGQVYTVQVKGTCDSCWFKLGAYNYEYNDEDDTWTATSTSILVGLTLDSDTGIWSNTFDCPMVYDGMSGLEIYNESGTSSYSSQIEWIKLEKGNTATDWTPAPEDIQDDLSAAIGDWDSETNTGSGLTGQINTLANSVDELQTKIRKWMTFDDDGLTIGSSEVNTLRLVLDNDKIQFLNSSGVVIGYWSMTDGYLYTGNLYVEVDKEARFGDFAFIPRSDGSLTFSKVG